MAENERLDAVAYLDRFFDELRDEVRTNPKFANRLVKAMGGKVVFEDSTKTDIANPYLLAAEGNKSEFYTVFSPLKTTQLKKILKDNNLATSVDIRGKSPSQLLDMLYDRASLKVSERKSSYF
ncbi:hypothetical protein [Hirschia maritima]|uniref:hypothetical protein n=1 Tax=Hirschia maritima TaxID=1121961 RepID=UPI00037E565B|nr:hypothetical protein [Hirschia maritima]